MIGCVARIFFSGTIREGEGEMNGPFPPPLPATPALPHLYARERVKGEEKREEK